LTPLLALRILPVALRHGISTVIPDAANRRSGIQTQALSWISGFRVRELSLAPRNDNELRV